MLDDPDTTGTGISEIAALSATRFVVDERDGDFGPNAYKKLWEVDVRTRPTSAPRRQSVATTARTAG